VGRVEEVLTLDPTRRGLSVRERARRWDKILERVVVIADACGQSQKTEKAKPLLKKRTFSLEASDRKMEVSLDIWQSTDASCKTDAVLTHILSKVRE
jgi:hypothetical protein